jgi:photosynthetic reaction center H subunit
MQTGAITDYIDVAQLVLYAFWIFFAGLIYYLHRENKREGYPLEHDRPSRVTVQGFPAMPAPKTYRLRDGSTVSAPRTRPASPALPAEPAAPHPGAALVPTGDPMTVGIGPGAYALRADVPDRTIDGLARIVPLRAAAPLDVAGHDADPRGLSVLGADGAVGGIVRELWVDRAEMLFRYLEVEPAGASDGRRVLVPVNFARIGRRAVRVRSIEGRHFAGVPRTRDPDQVTLLEEEKIVAYFGAGTLYANPARAEPLL